MCLAAKQTICNLDAMLLRCSVVLQGLKFVADSGVTVAAVIHQPSYETFCLFDDLLLLAKGGVLVYCGPQASVQV